MASNSASRLKGRSRPYSASSTNSQTSVATGADLPEEPIIVPLDRLRPTQVAVGMRAVEAKRRRLGARKRRKRNRYLARRPIPAVYGPNQELYIVDHHHLSLALMQNSATTALVKVVDDYSDLSPRSFWAAMEVQGFVYPYDEAGCRVPLSRMPQGIRAMKADAYRDLAWSVREGGGFKKTRAPYSEFRWAEFFRTTIPECIVKENYDRAVAIAMKLARSAAAAGLPGYRGE